MKHRGEAMSSKPTTSTKWLDGFDLNDRQRRFVLAYLKEPVAAEAARNAGYKQPQVQGPRLLSNVKVSAAIEAGQAEIETAAMIDAQGIVERWIKLADADPAELTQHLHGACRYCYGIDHQYQWRTQREFREALVHSAHSLFAGEAALVDQAIAGNIQDDRLPSDAGGYGYRMTADPYPDCPECDGLGIEIVRMADTRTLSESARMLYDGVEETKQGKKVKTRDRDRALENIAKHLGMFAGKVEEETTSPLSRFVQRIMDAAQPVPVRPDPTTHEGQRDTPAAAVPAASSEPEQGGGGHHQDTTDQDGEVEP